MKKYIIVGILAFILIMPIAGSSINTKQYEPSRESLNKIEKQNFTHTVMTEYATLTTCPPCVTASSQLYSIYSSGDLDFYYVTLVGDEGSLNIRSRLGELGVTNVPDVYFDGGYRKILGRQTDEIPYRTAISQSGVRVVPDIDMNIDVKWLGGGNLKITITVINNEAEKFNGHLRTYVVEKESRWNDYGGKPYHYAAIGVPLDKSVSIIKSHSTPIGDTYTFKKTWYGSLYGFGDITKDNIIVIAAVYDQESDHAVQAAAAEPTSSNRNLFDLLLFRPLWIFLKTLIDKGFFPNIY